MNTSSATIRAGAVVLAAGVLSVVAGLPATTILAGPQGGPGGPTIELQESGLRGQPQSDIRTLQFPGSDTVVRYGQGGYSISKDGGLTWHEVPQTSYILKLRYAEFDPLFGEPPVPPALDVLQPGDDAQPYIVQFHTQPLEVYRSAIRDAGGTIYNFLAFHSYIVSMTPAVRDHVEAMEFVRWVGEYKPAYRLEEELLDVLADPNGQLPPTWVNIQVFERGPGQQHQVSQQIAGLGGQVLNTMPSTFFMEAVLDHDQMLAVASLPEVLWIDRASEPETDVWYAREISGANYIDSELGFRGEGVRGEVMDSGLMTSHQAFQQRPPIIHGGNTTNTSHGTKVYGTVFGDGTGNPTNRGFLSEGQGIFSGYNSFSDRFAHTANLLNSPYHAVFQTNSWGSNRTTQYTSQSALMDDIIFNIDILITQSQSNAGNRNSRPQAWAKNIVAVGGVHQGTDPETILNKSLHYWQNASIGPAADGRIKPDLVHFYSDHVTTENNGGYGTLCCTSGATPITVGHFGLFFQMWSEGIFGNPHDPNGTVFENRPAAMTAKAMMINTADPYPFQGASHNLTRVHQGWGMADLRNLYDAREKFFIINEDDLITNLQTNTYELMVPAGEEHLRVTMIYRDPGGTTSSSLHRINDLTLKVTSPSGTVYWGNNGLMTGVWSVAGGSADTINTVENVFVQNPPSGTWTVEVIASEINQDGYPGTPQVDAAYALVAQGVVPQVGGAAHLLSATVLHGALLSGNVSALRESDNVTYDVQSAYGFSAGEANLLRVRVTADAPLNSASTMDVLFEGRIDNPGGITRIFVRNWSNNIYEEVGSFAIGQTKQTFVISDINADSLLRSSDGRIMIEYRQSVVATFSASGFISNTDHIQITVNN